ncbi:MAG: hypothetical protein HY233_11445 [Acidobacteriales bacterium]|nr:hypothetical protein [Terriglobales bacterium]
MSRFLASLLMTAVAMGCLAAQTLPPAARPQQRPVGCHGHGEKAPPMPERTSYNCCLTGHNAAVPQPCHSPQLVIQRATADLRFEPPTKARVGAGLEKLTVASPDPPGATPLRI